MTFVSLHFFSLPCDPLRGDGGVSERTARDLSEFAVQARALSVHSQASQRLCGNFPATAPGGGQRHRQGSHLLHGYVRCIHTPDEYTCPVECCSDGFASASNATSAQGSWYMDNWCLDLLRVTKSLPLPLLIIGLQRFVDFVDKNR